MALDFFLYVCIMKSEKVKLNKRIILVDTAYTDTVCGILRRHFGAEGGQPVPAADMAQWLVCCALDAEWRQADEEPTQVVFVRPKGFTRMENFVPGILDTEMDGMAFSDPSLGEFLLSVVTEEEVNGGDPLFLQCFRALEQDSSAHHCALVADTARYGSELRQALKEAKNCTATLISMDPQPETAGPFRQEVLGYSLMHAMHIKS